MEYEESQVKVLEALKECERAENVLKAWMLEKVTKMEKMEQITEVYLWAILQVIVVVSVYHLRHGARNIKDLWK